MNIRATEYFVETVKYENFTKAANSLYVSQPALSIDIPWVKKQVKDIGYKVLSYEAEPYEKKEKKGFFHFGKK